MNIIVNSKNTTVTPALKDYVERKISKLERYFDQIGDAKVTLNVEAGLHVVEATILIDGIILRAEDSHDDMYAAIDAVSDKLERQVNRHKEKLYKRHKHSGLKEILEEDFEEDPAKVVKTKRFNIKPMDVEEALLQMELLGHSFFVYKDADTLETCVVYKRKDGNYGLIEPEV